MAYETESIAVADESKATTVSTIGFEESETVEKIDNTQIDTSNDETDKKETDESKSDAITDKIPRIHFTHNSVIGKMLIDDGYVATPITICATSSIELNKENIPEDDDAFGELISKIYHYIITCKHPAVIMSKETFEIEFSIFAKINFNRFKFFKHDDYVFAYVIDEKEIDNFYKVIDIYKMDNEATLRYIVGTAYACNTMHNIFMYNDEDEVLSVMGDRNSVKELIALIYDDPKTEYSGHNVSTDILSTMHVINLKSLISDMYATLDDLIELEDEDDDDDDTDDDTYDIPISTSSDDDETEEYSDDTSVENFPDTSPEDIGALMDDIESDDNDDDDSAEMIKSKIYHR
jgi:hypothetical protein